jgi:predicted O-methyltransferase YrrM
MFTKLRTTISLLREGYRAEKDRRTLIDIAAKSGFAESAWLLYGLARSLKPSVAVEIGSAIGWSACMVGSALRDNGQGMLYAIDPHMPTAWNDGTVTDTYPIITRNVQKLRLQQHVTIVRKASAEAARGWDRKVDLIFIDGDHSYEGVKSDWEIFLPHMHPFTVAVFHDTIWEVGKVREEFRRDDMGVPRFVDELRAQGYPVITSPNNCGVSLVQPVIGGVRLRP